MSSKYQHDPKVTTNILRDIKEHRLNIAYIESDGYSPCFGYSIGLYKEFNHPELITVGLPPEVTGALINNIKNDIEKGYTFIEGINYSDFLINLPIQFVKVELEYYPDYLGYAGWYNDQSFNFPALQIVWPDREGNFPWDPFFNENLKFIQPLLDRNTDFKFLEERNLGVYTTSDVLNGAPILYIYHDEDGDWQFHSTADPDLNKSMLVSLETLVKIDETLNDIYYLNFGESAYRESVGAEWIIK